MAVFQTGLPQIAFPWEVDSISFHVTDLTSLHVRLTFDGRELYHSLLYPGVDQLVIAENISQLIIDEGVTHCALLVVYYSEDGYHYTPSQDVRIVPCGVVTQYRALEVVTTSFLTLLGGPKQTAPDGKEVVRLYSPPTGSEVLTITATFVGTDGPPYEVTNSEHRVGVANNVSSFYVDMSVISSWCTSESDRLVQVVVAVGSRRQTYLVNPHLRHSLRFLNCFGSEDVIYFSELSRDIKLTRTSGLVGGKHRTFYVEPSSKTSGTTAPLLDSELDWAEDAIHSIYFKDSDDKDVSITDNSFKHDSSVSSLPRLTLTWQLSQYRYKFSRSVKTFDFTFDTTYL